MSFRIQNGFMSIGVNLEKNREKSASNHINIIKNIFIHEKQHYEDYKKLGEKFFTDEMKDLRELRATHAQMEHETFQLTNSTYQESVKKYQEAHMIVLPIPVPQAFLRPVINPFKR